MSRLEEGGGLRGNGGVLSLGRSAGWVPESVGGVVRKGHPIDTGGVAFEGLTVSHHAVRLDSDWVVGPVYDFEGVHTVWVEGDNTIGQPSTKGLSELFSAEDVMGLAF